MKNQILMTTMRIDERRIYPTEVASHRQLIGYEDGCVPEAVCRPPVSFIDQSLVASTCTSACLMFIGRPLPQRG